MRKFFALFFTLLFTASLFADRLRTDLERLYPAADIPTFILQGANSLPTCTTAGSRTGAKPGNTALLLETSGANPAGWYQCTTTGWQQVFILQKVSTWPADGDTSLNKLYQFTDGSYGYLEKKQRQATAAVPDPAWQDLFASNASTLGWARYQGTQLGSDDLIDIAIAAASTAIGDVYYILTEGDFFTINGVGTSASVGRVTDLSTVLPSGWHWIGSFANEAESEHALVLGRNLSHWSNSFFTSEGVALHLSAEITTVPSNASTTWVRHTLATREDLVAHLSGLPPVATQSEAESGTSTSPRSWTPERVKQAIEALGGGSGGGITLEQATDRAGTLLATDATYSYNTATNALTTPCTDGQIPKASSSEWTCGTDNTGSGTGTTNLSITNRDADSLDVASSTGTDATIPSASTTQAGLQSSADKSRLDGITQFALTITEFTAATQTVTPTAANNGDAIRFSGIAASTLSFSANPPDAAGDWRQLVINTSDQVLTLNRPGNVQMGTLASGESAIAMFEDTANLWKMFKLSEAGTGITTEDATDQAGALLSTEATYIYNSVSNALTSACSENQRPVTNNNSEWICGDQPREFARTNPVTFTTTSATITPTGVNNGRIWNYTGTANSTVGYNNPSAAIAPWRAMLAHTGTDGTVTVQAPPGTNIAALEAGESGLAIFVGSDWSFVFLSKSSGGVSADEAADAVGEDLNALTEFTYDSAANSYTFSHPTNLSWSRNATELTMQSSTGANVAVPGATTAAAGLLTGADKTKIDRVPNTPCAENQILKAGSTGAFACASDIEGVEDGVADEFSMSITGQQLTGTIGRSGTLADVSGNVTIPFLTRNQIDERVELTSFIALTPNPAVQAINRVTNTDFTALTDGNYDTMATLSSGLAQQRNFAAIPVESHPTLESTIIIDVGATTTAGGVSESDEDYLHVDIEFSTNPLGIGSETTINNGPLTPGRHEFTIPAGWRGLTISMARADIGTQSIVIHDITIIHKAATEQYVDGAIAAAVPQNYVQSIQQPVEAQVSSEDVLQIPYTNEDGDSVTVAVTRSTLRGILGLPTGNCTDAQTLGGVASPDNTGTTYECQTDQSTGAGSGTIEGVRIFYITGQSSGEGRVMENLPNADTYTAQGTSNANRFHRLTWDSSFNEPVFSPAFTVTWLTSAQAEASNIDQISTETVPANHVFTLSQGVYNIEVYFIGGSPLGQVPAREAMLLNFIESGSNNTPDETEMAAKTPTAGSGTSAIDPAINAINSVRVVYKLQANFIVVPAAGRSYYVNLMTGAASSFKASAFLMITKLRN